MSATRPIDSFWAGFLGTTSAALPEPGVSEVPHAGLAGCAGVWFFVRGGRCVISAPSLWCARLEAELERATIDSLLSAEGLAAVFGGAFDSAIGPSYLGWLEPARFRPIASGS